MANEKRLIDADALVNFVEKRTGGAWIYKPDFRWAVTQQPTVDAVEVVHGRWLYDDNTERCFCSACNEEALYTSKYDPIFDYDWEENLRYSHTETILEEHLTNYCPNCGAKMDGGNEDGK